MNFTLNDDPIDFTLDNVVKGFNLNAEYIRFDLRQTTPGQSGNIPGNSVLYEDGSPVFYEDGNYLLYTS
jgi:hypothetical protein